MSNRLHGTRSRWTTLLGIIVAGATLSVQAADVPAGATGSAATNTMTAPLAPAAAPPAVVAAATTATAAVAKATTASAKLTFSDAKCQRFVTSGTPTNLVITCQ